MSDYILDLVLNSVDMLGRMDMPETPIWVIFKADGCRNNINTPQKSAMEPNWNFPFRFLLRLDTLSNAYLYVNFCTNDVSRSQVISLGVSKVNIRAFPVGRPKKFCFPLMSTTNTAIIVARINLTGTLSAFVPGANTSQQPIPTNYPSQAQTPRYQST